MRVRMAPICASTHSMEPPPGASALYLSGRSEKGNIVFLEVPIGGLKIGRVAAAWSALLFSNAVTKRPTASRASRNGTPAPPAPRSGWGYDSKRGGGGSNLAPVR